ncbi:hemolysin family protein [Dermabacter hominis]|uniref:hemolysin family protein n=1 Tax=Dermabacter hominis TaxID=36740 RepID=UPI0021A5D8FD|nr:hemolysin family protein [Dermabacter hominis]MCT2055852.1 hemolysin family protein [Dermabacter hominis]MCT2082707.1 hemolysin family protein [Dermabacter hominis]MCT2091029.1 hemolysin family protein [Dermabacter hominis]MCT2189891.1 hemolysin family protein [Dermabacter hominis]MCT2226531.1 hemolysin family protein [Dermabacter hominis]
MSDLSALLIGLAMLAGNAYFVGAEFAVMSVRRSQLEPLAAEGKPGAKTALWAIQHVSLMLATAQFGVTVCSVTLGAVAEPAIAHLIEPIFESFNVPEALVHPISFTIALLIASYLHVVLGEMVPKNLSIALPVGSARLLAPPLVWLTKILRPVIWLLNVTANAALRLIGVEPQNEVSSQFTAEDIAAIVDESEREGLLDDEQGLLKGAIQFSDHVAGDVMVPMEDVVTVGYGITPQEFEEIVARTGFSRLGVKNDAGDLVGYLHLKDMIVLDDEDPAVYTTPVSPGKVRAVVSVADDDDVEEVLRAMQYNGAHMARVDSANHRSVGAVFLEDVLEELVGEVNDVMQRQRLGGSRPTASRPAPAQ